MATPAFPGSALSKYNNDPGSGRTGYWEVPPNNYDFYTEEEKYKPNVQADGGILSSARPGDGAGDAQLPSGLRGRGCERSAAARGGRCRLASPGFREVASRLVLAVLSSARPRPARLGAHVQPHAGAGGCGPSEGVRNRGASRCVQRTCLAARVALRRANAGYIPPGDKYAGQAKIKLLVRSELVRSEGHCAVRNLLHARVVACLRLGGAAPRRGVRRAVLGGGEPQDED